MRRVCSLHPTLPLGQMALKNHAKGSGTYLKILVATSNKPLRKKSVVSILCIGKYRANTKWIIHIAVIEWTYRTLFADGCRIPIRTVCSCFFIISLNYWKIKIKFKNRKKTALVMRLCCCTLLTCGPEASSRVLICPNHDDGPLLHRYLVHRGNRFFSFLLILCLI